MTLENFVMIYSICGIVVSLINGFVRKIDGDALLGFAWFAFWFVTPLFNLVRLFIFLTRKTKDYQPLRRAKIYMLRRKSFLLN